MTARSHIASTPSSAAKVVQDGEGQAQLVLGDHQHVRLTGADTNGVLTLVEENNPAGVGVPLHTHRHEDELFHVIQGKVKFTIDNRTFVAGPGTTVWAPRGIPHAF